MAKKAESLLYVFIYLAVSMAANILVTIARPLLYAVRGYFEKTVESGEILEVFLRGLETQNLNPVTVTLLSSALALLFFWVIIKSRRIKLSRYLHTAKMGFSDVAASAFLAFGLFVVSTIIISLPVFLRFIPDYNGIMNTVMEGNIWFLLIAIGILGPIFEELIYRVVILGELAHSFSFFWANLIHAVVFGAVHGNPIQAVYAGVVGFALGYIYKKSGSVYIVILVHIFFNAGNILAVEYMGSAGVFSYYLAAGAASLLAGWLILKKRGRA